MSSSKKIVVLYTFGKGGPNIVWNMLQSHPQVCSAQYETNEILGFLILPRSIAFPYAMPRMRANQFPFPVIPSAIQAAWLRRRIHRLKMKNYQHPENGYKFEGVPYTRQEVEDSHLVLKSLTADYGVNDFLMRLYPGYTFYFVGLIRNGYALVESNLRRGYSAEQTAKSYRRLIEQMLVNQERMEHHLILRFEDALVDPFGVSEQLYEFVELEPRRLEKLRLKSKRVISPEGQHKPQYGVENKKYWFDRDSIRDIIVPEQSEIQAERLSSQDRETLNREARELLARFNFYSGHRSVRRSLWNSKSVSECRWCDLRQHCRIEFKLASNDQRADLMHRPTRANSIDPMSRDLPDCAY